jgi:hypothetical protein
MAANRLLTSFHAWAEGRPDLEPDVADTIVDLKATYLHDPQPGRWRTGDLETVLLELIPKHVSADDDWYERAVPTARAFVQHARSEGLLHKGSAPVFALMQELEAVEPAFLSAVRDSSRFGTAKSILSGGGESAMPDLDDPSALQKLVEEFNARPFAERKALTDQFDYLPDEDEDDYLDEDDDPEALADVDLGPLPAIRLAPAEELAEQIRANPFLTRLEQLLDWVGEGKPMTELGLLHDDERSSAVSHLRLDMIDEDMSDEDESGSPVERARWRLDTLWDVAIVTGLLQADDGVARLGDRGARLRPLHEFGPDSDRELLALWSRAVLVATGHESPRPMLTYLYFIDQYTKLVVTHLLFTAYAGDLHSVPQVIGEFADEVASVRPVVIELLEGRLRWIVTSLVDLGAVEPLKDPEEPVELTPLGRFGVREYALAKDIEAPLLGDVGSLHAAAFVETALAAPDDVREDVIDEWLEARGRSSGLDELLALVRDGSALTRDMTLSLLADVLSEEAFDEMAASFKEDPMLGPVLRTNIAERDILRRLFDEARSVFGPDVPLDELPRLMAELAERQPLHTVPQLAALHDAFSGLGWLHAELSTADRDVMIVERLAIVVEDADEPLRADDLPAALWKVIDEATLARLERVEHRELLQALDAIGTGHPSGKIRKAAKKAAHRARTTGPM